MGVEVVRPAVGRPAGVGEADRGVRRPVGDRGREVRELAGLLLDEQVAVLVDERDPGRVVAAVFEPLQALDQDRPRFTGPGIADDSAHSRTFLLRSRGKGNRRVRSPGDCAPVGQFSRSPASAAIESASSATRPASGPSIITRSAGSVPDGRTRTRPSPPSRCSAAADRALEGEIALPLVLVTGPDRALLLGQQRDLGREIGDRRGRPGHDPEDLERGDDPVARRRVLEDDHVAALLAAQPGAADLHPLEDVLVADRRPDDAPAGRLDRRLEPAVAEDRHDERALGQHAAREAVEREDARAAGRRRRPVPAASTATQRSASPSRANPTSAPRAATSRASDAGAVAPDSTLMFTPSGSLWMTSTVAPVAARISGPAIPPDPFAQSRTIRSPPPSIAAASAEPVRRGSARAARGPRPPGRSRRSGRSPAPRSARSAAPARPRSRRRA